MSEINFTLPTFKLEARAAMADLGVDVTTRMEFDNPAGANARPSTVTVEGTVLGEPVSQSLTATQNTDERASLAGVFGALEGVDLLADALVLEPGSALAENSARLVFADPRTTTMDKPVQMLYIPETTLASAPYAEFGMALAAYAATAFPGLEDIAPSSQQAVA